MNRKKSNGKRLLCTSRMLTAMIVLSVFTAGIGIAPVSAQVASVTRDLPVFVALNEEFEVTLTQTNFFFGIGTVFETLPEGFEYVVGSYTGNGDVDWDPATPRNLTLGFREDDTVTYRVTASSYGQNAEFSGTYATFVWIDGGVYEEGDVVEDTVVGVDGTPPYTDGHNPAKGATGVPVDTNIEVHVRDDFFVDPNSIVMNVQGSQVTPSKAILGLDHWLVTYDPPGNFNYGFTVVVTIDASDGAGNAMPQDVYSFTTEGGDLDAPVVTNPNAEPDIIPDDTDNEPLWGESSTLSVTVTDDSGIASVTVDLSAIGGSATQPMTNTGGDIWSVTTNASDGTAGWTGTAYEPYQLQVNATDEHGYSTTSVSIELTVMKNGDVDESGAANLDDAIYLANYALGVPGYDLVPEVADVDGSSAANLDDAIYLANHALGVPGYGTLH